MKKQVLILCLLALLLTNVFVKSAAADEPVVITWVDKRAEYADLVNRGQNAQDLTGWMLISEHGNQRCPLGGVIAAGGKLRVFAQSGTATDRAVFNCDFDTTIWNNSEVDPAVLCNADNVEVSRYPANASNPSSQVPACNQAPADATPNPPAGGEPCPTSGPWPSGCVPTGGSQPNPPPPPTNGNGQPCPASGKWPPGCVPSGGSQPTPPANGNGQPCPASGKWPPGCVPSGGASPAPTPPSNGDDACVIPESGPWPPCATGGDAAAQPPVPAPVATAHTYPTTVMQPFEKALFINEVRNLRTSFVELQQIFDAIDIGMSGSCATIQGMNKVWREDRMGFTEVPAQFNALYVEYRAIIKEAVDVTAEIEQVCRQGGGSVSEETDNNIKAFLQRVLPRTEQMVAEATVLD